MFYYEEVFKALNKAKVDYVVLGGVAAILHGIHRTTMDLDVMIDMKPSNIEKFWKVMQRLGYKPKLPVSLEDFKKEENRQSWQKEKNMQVFSFIHLKDDLKIIDIFIKDYLRYVQIKKEFIPLGSIKVPILSLDQLKKLKKIAGRPQDLVDLEELKRLKRLSS